MAAFMFNRAKCVAMKSASVFQCLKLLKNSFVAPRAQGGLSLLSHGSALHTAVAEEDKRCDICYMTI